MGGVKDEYRQLIDHYNGLSEEEIDDNVVKEEIIKKDKEISEIMTKRGISHFRYFPSNTNYFNYCKCG